MQKLIEILEQYTLISDEAKVELVRIVSKKKLANGQILLQQGNICRNLYFVESGFLRGFYCLDGKDISSWFALENDIAAAMYSFVTQKASFESIEVLEESVVYQIGYQEQQNLYHKYMEMNMIGRLLTEKYYIILEERKNALQYQSAKERYKYLVENQPQLLQKASLGMIASYLGITQETLSRIRNKI